MRCVALAIWLIAALPCLAQSTNACRQALLLAIDVSGSVDAEEYRLQLEGLAAALEHPQVVAALTAMPDAPVRLAVMEWSGPDYQRMILPWRTIRSAADLPELRQQLRATRRVEAPLSTAIGSALLRGQAELARAGQAKCWRRVIDVSGDGKSNTGPLPGQISESLGDVLVNGLVIAEAVPTAGEGRQPEPGELVAYFRAYVLHGPDAFLETAFGFRDFEAAMVRKLLRELSIEPLAFRMDTAN
ncbi:DUF1194 domain-containing protein [Pseudooceanicola sp. C21-150M6]|uniref:DUF1194 domain-containing protein n=1 Tax=Pseudooceanicola sp. C21-150M6 TaxID=3434355 RepID=UPI003D7FF7E4